MKRWDVFDMLTGAARRKNTRYRLDKDWESDTFYFDDPLPAEVNGKQVAIILVKLQTTKLRMDVEDADGLETLRLQTETVQLKV